MNWLRHNLAAKRAHFARLALLWLCLLLIAIFSVVQVAHYHKNPAHADNCAICLVLQHSAPMAAAALALLLFVAVARVAPASPQPARLCRSLGTNFIRPPPIG